MQKTIENLINEALEALGVGKSDFVVEHPARMEFGDYSTNVGIITGKGGEVAEWIQANLPKEVERVEVKGGFINFYLSKKFFKESLGEIVEKGEKFGSLEVWKGKKVMVEHTDPNPFKLFHIGHLMPNVIGSTIARIFEWNGAEVKQVNYQGDVGLHVAKAVWAGGMEPFDAAQDKQGVRSKNWGEYYSEGARAYEEDKDAKEEIQEINRKIYDKSDTAINELYEEGRKASLDYFEKIYSKLGAKFDYYFFESETAPVGKKIVEENMGKVFKESEGAVVFEGSHTRVFINSQCLPTYEAKDLGNAKLKYEKYPYDLSVVVTGNEIREYFKVVLEAMSQVLPDLAQRTKHLPHGMLRLPTGKMSSRTGDVITAEELIEEVKIRTQGREDVAIGAIKYTILRQSVGSDIVFDFEKSVSTEGDSGVYLQYAHARACSILQKSANSMAQPSHLEAELPSGGEIRVVERLLYRFPEVVERAGAEYSPNLITTYLTELASAFNNFYAYEQVLTDDSESGYRLAIVEAFKTVMKNGLDILGIPAPEKI